MEKTGLYDEPVDYSTSRAAQKDSGNPKVVEQKHGEDFRDPKGPSERVPLITPEDASGNHKSQTNSHKEELDRHSEGRRSVDGRKPRSRRSSRKSKSPSRSAAGYPESEADGGSVSVRSGTTNASEVPELVSAAIKQQRIMMSQMVQAQSELTRIAESQVQVTHVQAKMREEEAEVWSELFKSHVALQDCQTKQFQLQQKKISQQRALNHKPKPKKGFFKCLAAPPRDPPDMDTTDYTALLSQASDETIQGFKIVEEKMVAFKQILDDNKRGFEQLLSEAPKVSDDQKNEAAIRDKLLAGMATLGESKDASSKKHTLATKALDEQLSEFGTSAGVAAAAPSKRADTMTPPTPAVALVKTEVKEQVKGNGTEDPLDVLGDEHSDIGSSISSFRGDEQDEEVSLANTEPELRRVIKGLNGTWIKDNGLSDYPEQYIKQLELGWNVRSALKYFDRKSYIVDYQDHKLLQSAKAGPITIQDKFNLPDFYVAGAVSEETELPRLDQRKGTRYVTTELTEDGFNQYSRNEAPYAHVLGCKASLSADSQTLREEMSLRMENSDEVHSWSLYWTREQDGL
ncbi:hypothetical protein CYMTET_22641 [Cymbomonas tetramitiformis]|uniref:Uncharacterized protein n=1 Tax=Cymbomonas tetramitiformis TaxID=36881 RepID=A0AAE0L226_9CHLO|nr:hypothetical protein CYMTET_22641 [Cymbomonas tetramitiformis]